MKIIINNNIEQSNAEFIEDTLINRPSIKDKFTNYNKQDREQLGKIIADHKQVLEKYKSSLSLDCYNDLMQIYNWLILLLDNDVI